jgi:PHD/YefM family antitoxin component YafN of YafNO toxin-antitoxin module
MKVYTCTEARNKLSDLLDQASEEGEVVVRRRDGSEYVVRPQEAKGSTLDVRPVEMEETQEPISRDEIIRAVREGRGRCAGGDVG